eukprot:gene25987-31380_t
MDIKWKDKDKRKSCKSLVAGMFLESLLSHGMALIKRKEEQVPPDSRIKLCGYEYVYALKSEGEDGIAGRVNKAQGVLETRKLGWSKVLGLASILFICIDWGKIRGSAREGGLYIHNLYTHLYRVIGARLSGILGEGGDQVGNSGNNTIESAQRTGSDRKIVWQCADCGTSPPEMKSSATEEVKEAAGETTKAKQRRLDQMLEAQMISDILRAHNNLRAFNAFRVSHDATHREKELAEARRKEIQEPLEAAVFENELLHGKVTRREEVIRDLRRELLLENIRSKTASLSSREGGSRGQQSQPHVDVHQSDEYKINQMKDEIAELYVIIEHQERELDTCRKAMS